MRALRKNAGGECWYKPGSKKRKGREEDIEVAAELSQTESGEDSGSEEKNLVTVIRVFRFYPPPHAFPARARSFEQISSLQTHKTPPAMRPDTQAEISATNRPEHVVRKHPRRAKLQGLHGKPQVAQYADLAFRLKTNKGRAIVLRLRESGLFLPEAKEILLAHQDLEDAGCRVNYHTGKMHAPRGHVLTMEKSGAVWQIQ
jgi:hypothetical protein